MDKVKLKEDLRKATDYLKEHVKEIKRIPNPVIQYDKNDLMFIESQLEANMDRLDINKLTPKQVNDLAWSLRSLTEKYISLVEEQS